MKILGNYCELLLKEKHRNEVVQRKPGQKSKLKCYQCRGFHETRMEMAALKVPLHRKRLQSQFGTWWRQERLPTVSSEWFWMDWAVFIKMGLNSVNWRSISMTIVPLAILQWTGRGSRYSIWFALAEASICATRHFYHFNARI